MRVRSGVSGFDALMQGGVPKGANVLVQGPVGKEKDAMLFQFVVEGLRGGEAVLVVLSSVSPVLYQQALREAGIDVDRAILDNRLKFVDWFTHNEIPVLDVEQDGTVFRASIDLLDVGIAISRAIAALPREMEKRAAVEVLSPALRAYDLSVVHGFAQSTRAKLERFGFTSLFALEKEMHEAQALSSIRPLFDGVVDIERTRDGDHPLRRVSVRSLKGTTVDSKYVPIEFGTDQRLYVPSDVRPSSPSDAKRAVPLGPESPKASPSLEDLHLEDLKSAGPREKKDALEELGLEYHPEQTQTGPVEPAPPSPPKKTNAASQLLPIVEARLRGNPNDTEALLVQGAVLAQTGDLDRALAVLETLALLDDAHPGLWALVARVHAMRGDPDKAREARLRAGDVERGGEERTARRGADDRFAVAFECPQCGARVGENDTNCPSCGVRFAEGGPSGEPPPPMSDRTSGFTNGLARDRRGAVGRTNGLASGMTNGLASGLHSLRTGMTNGLTNGSGFTNGLGSGRHQREAAGRRWKLFLIPVLSAALLVTPLLGPADAGRLPITIDGAFADWSGVPLLASAPAPPMPPNVDLVRVGVTDNVAYLAFYFEVAGTALAGGGTPPIMDTFRAFLDTDRNSDTGYRVAGLGADRLVEVSGSGGRVQHAQMSEWDTGRDPMDWGGWIKSVYLSAAAGGSRVEAHVDWLALASEKRAMDVAFHAMAYDGATDLAEDVASTTAGNLRIVETPVVPQTISGTRVPLVEFALAADVRDVTYDSLTVTLTGTAPVSMVSGLHLVDALGADVALVVSPTTQVMFAFPPRTVARNATELLVIAADVTGITSDTLGARIDGPHDIGAGSAAVSIVRVPGARAVGYLGTIPVQAVVDGGFAEWTNTTTDATGEAGVPERIDLTESSFYLNAQRASAYFRVSGRAMDGAVVPAFPSPAPEGGTVPPADSDRDGVPDAVDPLPFDFNNDGTADVGTGGDYDADGVADYPAGPDHFLNTTIPGTFPAPYAGTDVSVYIGPIIRPVVLGEDVARVFFDANNDSATGFRVGAIGAEYLVEIRGKHGLITSRTLSAFGGGSPWGWTWTLLESVDAASDSSRVELGFDVLGRNLANASRAYFELRDWSGALDDGGMATSRLGTRGTTLIDPNSNAVSTLYNHQRKVVRAGDTPGGTCDASNSDGCFYAVFSDQLVEGPSNTPPTTETITTGSRIGGVFPTNIRSEDATYVQYRESALSSATASFNTGTGTTAVDLVINFQAKAMVLWLSGRTGTTDSFGGTNHLRGTGFGTSVSDRRAICSRSDDGVATLDTAAGHRADAILCSLDTNGIIDGLLDISSIDADSVTFVPDDAFPADYRVHALFLGGSALTNAATGMFQEPAAPGDQNIVVPGSFQPEAVLMMSAMINANPPGVQVDSSMMFGFAAGAGNPNDVVWSGGSDDGVATSQTMTYARTGESIALYVADIPGTPTSVDVNARAEVDAWNSDGFSLNWIERASTRRIHYLALDGLAAFSGDFTTSTILDTDITETGFGFSPSGALFISAANPVDGADAPRNVADEWSMGAFDSATSRRAHGTRDNDGAAPSAVGSILEHDEVYAHTTTGDAIEGLVDVQSVEPDGFILNQDDPDPAANYVGYIAFGGTATMEVRYDWTGVPQGDSYTLQIKGYRTDEDINVQVLDPSIPTWNTRITVSATTNTMHTYTLTSVEYNAGAPAIRFVDALGMGGPQSDFFVDFANIVTNIAGGANSQASTETITTGTKVAGTFPSDLQATDDVNIQYREAFSPLSDHYPGTETDTMGGGCGGAFPTDLQSSNDAYRCLREGGGTFYFRNAGHTTEVACTGPNDKVATSAQGPGPAQTVILSPGEDACWYVDETTGTTIPAGDWETRLDVSKGVNFVNRSFVEQTTRQTTSSSTYVDITGASIPSSGFTAGRKYLLVITAQVDSTTTTANAFIQTLHGSTAFPGSEFSFQTDATASRHSYYWYKVWTAVGGEGVKLQFRTEGAATTGADQITLFKLDLGALTETTDWFYDENTAGDTISGTTWDGLASITFTPSAASDWLIMTTMRGDPDSVSVNYESRIARTGAATETQPLTTWEGNDATNSRYVQTLARVFSLTALSNTFSQESRCSAACTYPRSYSSVFALNLNRFEDRTSVWTEPPIALSTTNFATQIQTTSMTPTRAGGVWIVAQTAVDVDTLGDTHKFRLQVDNVDQPGTQTGDVYNQWAAWDAIDEVLSAIQTVENLSASPHTFDVDASRTGTTAQAEDRVLFAISLALSPVYDVQLQIWNKNTDTVAETVGSCQGVTTFGDDVQCLVTGLPRKTVTSTQVVRIRVAHPSSSGTVGIDYDDLDGTGDSRTVLPAAQLSIQHDWTGIPTDGVSYDLCVEAYIANGAGESMLVQVLSPGPTWNTRITVTKTADDNTDQCYTLTGPELNAGNPSIRWIGGTESGDPQPSDINIDHERIRRRADGGMEVRYDWAGVLAGDSYTLQIKGYRTDENINVQVFSSAVWNTRITISATTNTMHTYTLTSAEYNGGAPSIRFVDANGVGGPLSDFFIDFANIVTNVHWDRVILMRSADTSGTAWGSQIILASGRAWDSPLLLARDSTEPSIAIDSGGFLHVVWAAANASGNQQTMDRIRYAKTMVAWPTQAHLSLIQNWAAVEAVDDLSPGFMPTISTDMSNAPHIAWSSSKTSGTVYYRSKVGSDAPLYPGTETIAQGSACGGTSFPTDLQSSNNIYRCLQEASADDVQYFRNTNDAETSCTVNKETSGTQGGGPAQTASVTTGQSTCWYADGTAGTTIPAGSWRTLLDISRTDEIGAIGYKSNSGACAISLVNCPKELDWTGSAWGTPETELATIGAAVENVRVIWDPAADSTLFWILVNRGANIYAFKCTNVDSCALEDVDPISGNDYAVTQTVGTAPERHWDAAIEASSGEILLLYDDPGAGTTNFCYRTRTAGGGGAWSAETCFDHSSIVSTPSLAYITLAANPGSNLIGMGAFDTTNNDFVLGVWDGGAWVNTNKACSAAVTLGTGWGGTVAAEDSANEFVAWCGNGADSVAECEWTSGGGWEGTCATFNWDADAGDDWKAGFTKTLAGTNEAMVCATNDLDDQYCYVWNGVAGTMGSRVPLGFSNAAGCGAATICLNIGYDWNPDQSGTFDGLFVYYESVTGQLGWGTFNDATDAVTFGTPFASTGSHLWVSNYATKQAGNAVKVHVVASNSVFDILAYRWTGAASAPANEQVVTADTVDQTYPYFDFALATNPSIQYDVALEIWNVATDVVDLTIGTCLDVTTYGDDVQCLIPGVAQQTLTSNQVVRIRVSHSSTYGAVRIDYDDADATGNARAVIPRVQLLARHDWSGVPTTGSSYDLCVEAYIANSGGQSMLVQVLTPPSTWNTRITVTKTTDDDTDQCYTLTGAELNTGAPSIRWVGGLDTTDPTQSDIRIDHERITAYFGWRPLVSWGATYTGISVDVSPVNDQVSVVRYFEGPPNEIQYTVCKTLSSSGCDDASEFTKADGTPGYDTVATNVEPTSYPSLATTFNANGDLWIAYAKDVDGTTRAIYAVFLDYPAATFTTEIVDSLSGTIFTTPSIGIDKDNNVHALYVAISGPQLYYNKRTSGSWGTRTAVDTFSSNPTVMVRAPNDATYGTGVGGLYWKPSETYFHVPEFEAVAAPILGILLLTLWRQRRGRRRRVDDAGPATPRDEKSDGRIAPRGGLP